MIAAWMVYSAAVTLLLFAACIGFEFVARALRAPTRLVWAFCMIASITLSARALISGLEARASGPASTVRSVVVDATNVGAGTVPAVDPSDREATADRTSMFSVARAAADFVRQSTERLEVARLERWNRTLVALWAAASLLALGWLAGSAFHLRQIERRLRVVVVDNQAVLVSKDVGPALFGILRARIVLPEWVLALPRSEREIILSHERQHAAAFDPAVIHGAALIVFLQPWNVGLWFLFARLRLAVEGDCDRRVLGATGDARQYGNLLIAVYQRATAVLSPYVAFVERPSNLERRVQRLMRRPRLLSLAGAMSSVAAVVLVTAAWGAVPPQRRLATPVDAKVVGRARCSIFGPAEDQKKSGEVRDTPFGVNWFSEGCSIFGDIVVVAVDSTHILVVARDTADVGVRITAFIVYETQTGSVPTDLAWSTTSGRAELSKTTVTYAGPDAVTKRLVLRFKSAGVITPDPNAHSFLINNILIAQMQGIPWDVIAALPTSPRCAPVDQEPGVIRPRPGGGILIDEKLARACFTVRGERFEFPIL